MPLYQITPTSITALSRTTFADRGIKERDDLQRLLRTNIDVIAPDVLVLAEEFGEWDDSKRRIDLLGLDKQARLVVIELKRSDDGGHTELQSLRYAAMVSTITFDQAVSISGRFLTQIGSNEDPRARILTFLSWTEPRLDEFAQDVRIVLAAADFSKEITTSVLWLNERDLDIRCVRMRPYAHGNETLLDVEQVLPLPETAAYQVQVSEKQRHERAARQGNRDYTKFDVTVGDTAEKGLNKRRALLFAVQGLVKMGVAPSDIQKAVDPKFDALFRSVEGSVESTQLLAAFAGGADGRAFDATRYFCADEDLIGHAGRTYVFYNQWGAEVFANACQRLVDTFSTHKVQFSPVADVA